MESPLHTVVGILNSLSNEKHNLKNFGSFTKRIDILKKDIKNQKM